MASAPTPAQLAALHKVYASASQSHVFQLYDTLSPTEQATLYAQLLSINPSQVNSFYTSALAAEEDAVNGQGVDKIEAPPAEAVGSVTGTPEKVAGWEATGMKAISESKVGVLLMAGGQGTRLGSSDPKGCYDIGLPSSKSLFALQAERIRRLEVLAGCKEGKGVRWYIMTSGPTRAATEEFFKANKYFGLREDDVIFFEQGVLPCLTNEGKILLASASAVAVAPDGNGGIYAALRSPLSPSPPSRTVLSDLDAHGITYLHAYCVDNCLVRVACPIFLGYCIDAKADCGAKVVVKTAPEEAVGVVALKGGKFGVVEYSEIPTDLSEARTSEGELVLRAANIANHFYTTKFLHSIASFESKMAHHIARKKIAHISLDEASLGQVIKPTKVNGMKLELFVFDVFPFVPTFALLEAERSTDFSPLKNAPGTGSDDPQTSRRDLLRESKRWLVDAGATVPDGVEIEVAAAVSYAGEGLESVKGLHFGKSGVVERVEDFQSLVV